MQRELAGKIERREAVVGVVGLGYVGLPLILAFRNAGFPVIGYDIDPSKVDQLMSGRSYIRHIDAETIQAAVAGGSFDCTTDFDRLSEADALLMCVPTPLTVSREPDLRYIEATLGEVSKRLRPGQLVVLESTTYPGTTDEVLLPVLSEGGLDVGRDFFLAYSPEREDPGNINFSTTTIPKVVGGYTEACRELACALYDKVVSAVVPVTSTAVAELTKLFENVYRSVNIALVNELKVICHRMGLDVHEVIAAAATKPFGFQAFYPGPGLGGHCIPIDPFYLTWKARQYDCPTRFIELAGEVNTAMPYYVVDRVASALNERKLAVNGSNVLILGVAYKRDVDDLRESPALRIIELLKERGAEVAYHDPFVPVLPRTRKYDLGLSSVALTAETVASYDAVLVITDHTTVDYELVVKNASLVVDSRNATGKVATADGGADVVQA